MIKFTRKRNDRNSINTYKYSNARKRALKFKKLTICIGYFFWRTNNMCSPLIITITKGDSNLDNFKIWLLYLYIIKCFVSGNRGADYSNDEASPKKGPSNSPKPLNSSNSEKGICFLYSTSILFLKNLSKMLSLLFKRPTKTLSQIAIKSVKIIFKR